MAQRHGPEKRLNEYGQPIGPALPGFSPRPFPKLDAVAGTWCQLEPLVITDIEELFAELCGPENDSLWTYSAVGPFHERSDFATYVEDRVADTTTVAVTIRDGDGIACGLANLLAIRPEHGVLEVGSITYGPRLRRTVAATEAMYLLARHVFDLGHRRYEWKCDALNEPSRRAALRLGFRYEGRFRNAVVTKGRSRDTDWFSITDAEWPAVRDALQAWLDPANQPGGHQLRPLQAFRAADHRPDAAPPTSDRPTSDQPSSDRPGAERAAAALRATGIGHTITRHGPVRSLEEAAKARGVAPAQVIKTMVVRRGDDDYLFVLVPGDRQISWPKLRAELGVSRLSMPDAEVARQVTGYQRGTITPLGAVHAWPVVADARVDGTVSIGAGDHGVSATVEAADLLAALGAHVADITDPQ